MATRKRKRPVKSVKLDEDAHAHLETLVDAVSRLELPAYVDQMEILSALVLYTTPEQLEGMLRGYWRYTNRLREQGGGGT